MCCLTNNLEALPCNVCPKTGGWKMVRHHKYISFSTLKTDHGNTLWSNVLFKPSRPAHYYNNVFRPSQMHWVWHIIRIQRSNRLLWNSIKQLFYSESPWLLQPCFYRSSQFHTYMWHIMKFKGCFQVSLLYSMASHSVSSIRPTMHSFALRDYLGCIVMLKMPAM